MANINLISARRAEYLRQLRTIRILLAVGVATVALGLGGVVFSAGQLVLAQRRAAHLESQLQALRPLLAEIEAAQKARQALVPKLTTLTGAQQQTRHWHDLLEGFKRAIPEGTWLTNLSADASEKEPARNLRIHGITESQSRVGETMYRLSLQEEFYEQINLSYTQTTQVARQPQVEFELTAQLKGTSTEEKAGDKDADQAE